MKISNCKSYGRSGKRKGRSANGWRTPGERRQDALKRQQDASKRQKAAEQRQRELEEEEK